jgi:CHAT domain-containing protein/tetratricopeptide (TPR) repeat protein
VQNSLGVAYSRRIHGNRQQNLETALSYLRAALQVRNRKAFPADWVMTQNNMGTAFYQRLKGNRANNLERAIACLEAALQVCAEEGFSEQWAMVQDNLGTVYRERIKGDRAENLEKAIAAHKAALQVYTPDEFRENWARTQYHLGVAYSEQIRGEVEQNLDMAIAAYNAALEVFTLEMFPQMWAMIQNSLGLAYAQKKRDDPQQNLAMAIAAYQSALLVYTCESLPREWGMVQNNLGNAYSDLKNLEQAIIAYQAALQIYTSETDSYRWAAIQNNLAAIYRDQGNISAALNCLKSALKVFTPSAFPIECLKIGRNLGYTAFAAQHWEDAIKGYGDAIKALETSRGWVGTDARRQEMIEEALDVYLQMVQACLNNNQSDKALEYVERSKARTLVERLAKLDLYPKGDVSETSLEKLKRLRREILAEEQRLEIEGDIEIRNSFRPSSLAFVDSQKLALLTAAVIPKRTHLNQLQQELEQLITQEIKPIDQTFNLIQQVEGISFDDIRSMLDERTAIIEWYITAETFHTFIITHQSQKPIVCSSSPEDLKNLVAKFDEYIAHYRQEEGWMTQLSIYLQNFAEILNLDHVISLIPKTYNQVILIPYRALHLIPIHALPLTNNQCLLDRFPGGIKYAPSCQLLQQAQARHRPNFDRLFAIQNPTEDLAYTNLEVLAIQTHFRFKQILVKKDASKANLDRNQLLQNSLDTAHCAHFSCHGYFNFNHPLLSALLLTDCYIPTPDKPDPKYHLLLKNGGVIDLKKCLTLADIFSLDLRQCRLVTISACETGLTDFNSYGDEYIGLPSGFLVAGTPSTVSSLWTVNDLSTALLMAKFYENLQYQTSVAIALNQAQLWIRDITGAELCQWIQEKQLPLDSTQKLHFRRIPANRKPFRDPFYWAAFCAIGQ